jgi:dipeptidyl aminopeptidase/acylaminoacyl peptidase
LSVPRKGSHRDVFNLSVIRLDARKTTMEVLFDHHGPGAAKPSHPAPSFPLPEECWDGDDNLIYHADIGVHTHTARVDLKTRDGRILVVEKVEAPSSSTLGRLQRRRQLTPPGHAFLKDRLLGESKVVSWENGAAQKIEGILTLPPASVAKAPFKLLLYPHGGPHSRSALGFDFAVQLFAAHGYAVFQPNYRGSAGYGQKFIDADRHDLGGGDVRDILTGIDYLVKEGLVQRERQFVFGSSYGGFLTCWLLGNTRQFRAAAAQNAVTDMSMMWGLSDIPSWVEWEVGSPWQAPEALRRHSPLTYADKVRTPTLILHSRDDRRCPLPMGLAFHRALRAHGVATDMVIYPGEGHGIRQPRHRADVLRRVLAWLAQHDKE